MSAAKEKKRAPINTSSWDVVRPNIQCADVWNREDLDSLRMGAYKELEAANQIWIDKITYNKESGMVVVEYRSTVPHEMILMDLKGLIESVPPVFTPVEQLTIL